MATTLAESFSELFDGFKGAHGEFEIKFQDERGKAQGRAMTVSGAPNWDKHLKGTVGQGVIPLREDNQLMWGAIDIDNYKLGIVEIQRRVAKAGFPLLACETKSKGVHLYLFLEAAHPAQLVRDKLGEWAAKLGFGGSEIFPKQSYRANAMDIGNWLNMPYFGGNTRRCWDGAKWLTAEEFLSSVVRTTISRSLDLTADDDSLVLEGAPPCLCHFEKDPAGVPDGHRHNTILTLLVYCRKRFPDTWQAKVHELQRLIYKPELSQGDIEQNVKSMAKKTYDYQCNGPWCDKAKCKKVQFGRGEVPGGDGACEIGSVTKLVGDPVMWIVEVDGNRVVCSTDQLYSQHLFNKLCMEVLSRCPGMISQPKWMEYLDQKIRNADIIQSPTEATPEGMFRVALEGYLTTGFLRAQTIDETTLDRVYVDSTNTAYFKGPSLFGHLDEIRFRYKSNHQVWQWLRNLGCTNVQRVINNRAQNIWMISLEKAGIDCSSNKQDPDAARTVRVDNNQFD